MEKFEPLDQDRFLSDTLQRRLLGQIVTRAGFSITRLLAKRYDTREWGLHLKPNRRLESLFGQRLEILLWVDEHRNFQARTITAAQGALRAARPRLCEDFAIVISADSNAAEAIASTSERLDTLFAGFSMTELSAFGPGGPRDFVSVLQSKIFVKDAYLLTGAVTSHEHFFGRQQLVREIESILRQGGRHVGLFGLRKMGKTSFLFRILQDLRRKPSILVAHLDVERIDAIQRTAPYFLWCMGESLIDANRDLRTNHGFRLFGIHKLFLDIDPARRDDVPELFQHDITLLLKNKNRRIIFLFDEIERMWPGATSKRDDERDWGASFPKIWRLLRGLDQENPGRVSYFIAGTSPTCLENNHVGGTENPIYNYFSKHYLPQLDDISRRELLEHTGTRMGLSWSSEALDIVESQVSGHPALLRAVGSHLHRALLPRERKSEIGASFVRQRLDQILAEINPYLAQMMGVLEESYRDDYMLLELLAAGRREECAQYAEAFPDAIAHLRGYELVDGEGEALKIELEALHTWLQRRKLARATSSSTPNEIREGDVLGSYKLLTRAGRRGGFGQTWRAHVRDSDAALCKRCTRRWSSAVCSEIARCDA